MITLIHGEDTTESRNFYFDSKKQSQDFLVIDGTTVTLTDLQQALSGSDLFATKKDIFIENLVSKRKSPKDVEALTEQLTKSDAHIVVWESKELTKKQIELFGKAVVRLFKIPSVVFALLDGLRPANGKQLLELFHKTLSDKDPEFVLVMLQRQTRMLLALQNISDHAISEVVRLAPWQKGKLVKQAQLFTSQQLINLHKHLFQLELDMKTGNLSQPLDASIDLLLLSL